MKILEKNDKTGEITVQIENLNDLWSLYNVIAENDKVAARTQRRIVLKEGSKGERKPMYLKINVEVVSFHEFSNRLRIKGIILEGPEDFVSFGTYHTLNIEIGQKLVITKEKWLRNEIKRLNEPSKFEVNFNMIIVAIETGLATISLTTNFSHKRIATIKKNIPGKRYEQTHRNKAIQDFFLEIEKILGENIKINEINLIVLCGPGSIRDHFLTYLKEKVKVPYLNKIQNFHASSGTESGIIEILKSKKLAKIKTNVKILQETQKIEEIFILFDKNPDLVAIGFDEIDVASERGAVKELFLVDTLIRGAKKNQKLHIEKIISNVENSQGIIHIMSSEHPTGQRINDLGSLVAILRYKI
jgi:protein pelota